MGRASPPQSQVMINKCLINNYLLLFDSAYKSEKGIREHLLYVLLIPFQLYKSIKQRGVLDSFTGISFIVPNCQLFVIACKYRRFLMCKIFHLKYLKHYFSIKKAIYPVTKWLYINLADIIFPRNLSPSLSVLYPRT